jgi:hypothetical protein
LSSRCSAVSVFSVLRTNSKSASARKESTTSAFALSLVKSLAKAGETPNLTRQPPTSTPELIVTAKGKGSVYDWPIHSRPSASNGVERSSNLPATRSLSVSVGKACAATSYAPVSWKHGLSIPQSAQLFPPQFYRKRGRCLVEDLQRVTRSASCLQRQQKQRLSLSAERSGTHSKMTHSLFADVPASSTFPGDLALLVSLAFDDMNSTLSVFGNEVWAFVGPGLLPLG